MIDFKAYSLKQLKTKFDNREFAIPSLQRQYVWNKPRIAGLMDSIFRGYPIGIGLIWSAPFSQAIHIRPNHKTIIPAFNKKAKRAELIIDGQQRLSTLFGILNGLEERPEAGSNVNFKHLFFDCHKNAAKRFVFNKRYDENTKGLIRLTDLINTQPSVLRKRLSLTKWEATEALRCYNAFHNYKFYILESQGNSIDDVREIFIRINSAGMNVSRADSLFAKATDVNLREQMLDVRRGLKHDYDTIAVETMQAALSLAYGANAITGKALSSFVTKLDNDGKNNAEFNKIWKKMQYGYEEAVDFLVNHLKVKHPKLLPYGNMYAMLTYFFYLTQSRAKPAQLKEIRKWFWHTACAERYSGASFNTSIPEDIKFFKRLSENPNAKYMITEKASPADFLKAEYRRASSIANAYFLMLRIKKPLYLLNGEEIMMENASSISNRKDRHHIYPYALLRRNQVSLKWINAIVNICYLESDENQSISDKHPKNYLEEYKRLKHFKKVMQTHLIDTAPSSPVWEGKTKQSFTHFIIQRGRRIIAEIEKLAGTPIFEKFDGIKKV